MNVGTGKSRVASGLTMKGFPKAEQMLVSEEEMQRLYLDGRAIRRYCLECRGPKFMMPAKKNSQPSDLADAHIPEKYQIVCKTCGRKYTAALVSLVRE